MDLITLGIGPQGSIKYLMTGGLDIGEEADIWTPVSPAGGTWSAQSPAAGVWTPVAPASGTWTEQ